MHPWKSEGFRTAIENLSFSLPISSLLVCSNSFNHWSKKNDTKILILISYHSNSQFILKKNSQITIIIFQIINHQASKCTQIFTVFFLTTWLVLHGVYMFLLGALIMHILGSMHIFLQKKNRSECYSYKNVINIFLWSNWYIWVNLEASRTLNLLHLCLTLLVDWRRWQLD